MPTGYWEKRFLPLVFLFACLLAPIPLVKFVEYIHARTNTIKRNKVVLMSGALTAFISIIVLSGFSSTVLQFEYWFTISNNSPYKISDKEWQAIHYLKNIFEHDPRALAMTPSTLSRYSLIFAAPSYQISTPKIVTSSKYPEIPLFAFSAYNLKHAYIYMDSRDFELLNEQQQGNWFTDHLLPILPVIFSNGEVTVYNATLASFPLPNSDSVMLIPSDPHDDSWLYAYDIVSQLRKNYTVMYDSDAGSLKGNNTTILSFDPSDHHNFYENFSSSRSINHWNIISGKWNYTSAGLEAGEKSQNTNNVILSPVASSSKNFTASTLFRVNGLANSSAASYVSIIYSWVNPADYEYAGIMLYNNAVYLYSTAVENGNVTTYPAWPGMKTDLKWKEGDLINMTLSIQNEPLGKQRHVIFLNGTKYLLGESNSIPTGKLGLSYSRIQDVMFNSFKIQETNYNPTGRTMSEYIKYVKAGGHLIVLDTNGYGSLANFLFRSTVHPTYLKEISLISANYSNSRISPNYQSLFSQRGNSSSFALKAVVGHGTITYINMYPILTRLSDNRISIMQAYTTFGQISKMIGPQLRDSNPSIIKHIVRNHIGTFRQLFGTGNMRINTTSAIFPRGQELDQIKLTTFGNRNISVANITNLVIDGYRYVLLDSNHINKARISLANGKGLYSNIVLSRTNKSSIASFDLSFINNNHSRQANIVTAQSNDGKLFSFENISSLQIQNKEPIQVYVREPDLNIDNGNITIKGLYLGQVADGDEQILGHMSLSIYMSDVYSFVNHFSGPVPHHMTQPAYSYNGLDSFSTTNFSLQKLYSLPVLVRALLLIPFLVAAVFIIYVKPKDQKQDQFENV